MPDGNALSILKGTCSECGGPVYENQLAKHPIPTCRECGATAKYPHGPRIQMTPRPPQKIDAPPIPDGYRYDVPTDSIVRI